MSNSNYMPLLSCNGGYYTAASAGAFNERAAVVGSFGAFVAFVINGGYQRYVIDENTLAPPQWLWGNFDTTPKTGRGWSITMRTGAGNQGELVARVTGADGTVHEAVTDLTFVSPVCSPIGNIIVASLWYVGFSGPADNQAAILALAINGSMITTTRGADATSSGYLPSPYAARLGADPVNAALLSPNIEFISCGYTPAVILDAADGDTGRIGEYAHESWRAFYSGYADQSFVAQDGGLDWRHRYSALQLAQGLTSSITKNPTGAFITSYGPAGAVMDDLGNQSTNPAQVFSPALVPLNRTGDPRLLGAKNIPYYTPLAPTFPFAAP